MERIGEFSKRCKVTIKTLRYYDKLGLLVPDYIDKFTGYRYYGLSKVEEMRRISELKDIGFSLDEIMRFCTAKDEYERNKIINEKHWELTKLTEKTKNQIEKLETFIKLKEERSLKEKHFQTIDLLSAEADGGIKMNIDFNTPFENDERVIGRWEFVATVDKKADFLPGKEYDNITIYEEIYFLPNGEDYWGFSWTKDYIKISFGDGFIIPYELEDINGEAYIFADRPDYGGVWVLKQVDNNRYNKWSIAKNDAVDLPFVDDPKVHGQWYSIGYVQHETDFDTFNPKNITYNPQYLRGVEFFPDGVFEWEYTQKYKHRWTKGTTMIKYYNEGQLTHTTAPAYQIRTIDNIEYLFLEWKSGDYTWGKMKPGYYVLQRGTPKPEPAIHFNMPFEDDETMVGRWEMIGTFNIREEFIYGGVYENDSYHKEIYFLPGGKWYWLFSWTKGYIKNSSGWGNKLIPYKLEEINGERFMFAECENEYGYKPIWVLKQTDHNAYTAYDIGQWDNIEQPFEDDPDVHGKWTSVDFVDEIEDFNPIKQTTNFDLYLISIEFLPNGCVCKTFSNDNIVRYHWTKGVLLEHFGEGTVAPKYDIRRLNGADYLFMQWISGDYVWGKMKPSYYVFKRA